QHGELVETDAVRYHPYAPLVHAGVAVVRDLGVGDRHAGSSVLEDGIGAEQIEDALDQNVAFDRRHRAVAGEDVRNAALRRSRTDQRLEQMAVRVNVHDVELQQIVPRRLEDAERQVELAIVGEAVVQVAEAPDEDAVDGGFR